MSLSVRLRELRVKKGESLQAVADAVGVSKTHIWELEKGHSENPSIDMLTKLANHFKVTISELVGEDLKDKSADKDLLRMFRQAQDSDLTSDEKKHLDEMLQSLLRMKAMRRDAD